MERKQCVLWYAAAAVVLALGSVAAAGPAGLVGHWTFDEGQGTTAFDSSGNGLHGALRGNPTWATGQLGGALDFNGSSAYVEIPHHPLLSITGEITIAAWTNMRTTASGEMAIVSKGSWAVNNLPYEVTEQRGGVIFWQFYNDEGRDTCSPNSPAAGEWHHIAATYDGRSFKCYIDGKLGEEWAYAGAMPTNTMAVNIGRRSGGGTFFNGRIDDVQLWKRALPEAEINKIMAGLADTSIAQDPSPEDQAVDVPRDAVLSWKAGEYPATHDVYLGTAFADVNTATRTNPGTVLAGKGQPDTTFDPPGSLAYGRTYYWRIDEVNKTPDNTIFKGNVWSFTTEPYGYPVKPIAAKASSFQAGMGPEKTIDGSGLDKSDLHGIEPTTMWMSAGTKPNWIQYEFDRAYKLHELRVWNSNQLVESFLGFGAKSVKIETSTDGATWTALTNVPNFARAPGTPGYAANTTVSLGGVEAKFVKLTIDATWGGIAPQAGLAEVRFFYIPVQARLPQPAQSATGVKVDTTLNWRPGREAGSHKVFLGTDQSAVAEGTAAAKTVTDHSFTPSGLNLGTTYYWKVDEVNTVTYPGDVWSFTTQEYQPIEDFESYTDKQGEEVFTAWVDGMTNGNGSTVGLYPDAVNGTFCETTIIHGGKQSMPFEYNNVKTPYYSEAERVFDTPQDWTGNGADTLSFFLRGYAVGFADKGNNAHTVSSTGSDIWGNSDQFRFVFKQLSGNGSITAKVDALSRSDAWSKAGVMIREALEANSRHASTVVTPDNSCSFQRRPTTGAASTSDNWPTGTPAVKAPYWVRITRTGNTFKSETSADGKTWTVLGTEQNIQMSANLYIGLAVTSHNASAYSTAEFSNVSTTGTVTGAWQSLSIGVTQRSNDPAPLYLVVEDKAGKKKTAINPNPGATAVTTWTEWRIPLSDLTGINLAAVKKVTLGVGDRTSPKPGGAGKLFIDDLGFGHPVK